MGAALAGRLRDQQTAPLRAFFETGQSHCLGRRSGRSRTCAWRAEVLNRQPRAERRSFREKMVTGQQGAHFADSLVSLMRDADALAHVVRAFQNPAVPHPHGRVNAVRDFHALNNELLLADLAVVEKRLERLTKDLKKVKNPELESEYALLQRGQEALEAERPLRSLSLTEPERKRLRGFGLLTQTAPNV